MLTDPVTKSDLQVALQEALAPLATKADLASTKDEFQATVASLVTKDEFQATVATLVTKKEFQTGLDEVVVKVKHEFGVVAEQFRSEFGSLHDAFKSVDQKVEALAKTTAKAFAIRDLRFNKLEDEVGRHIRPAVGRKAAKGRRRR